ncbi:MAG TPA: tetratricopeptide repeat protein, partial [bacterium]|nr:tetratricopeptide repeat protein [bacterium]
MKRYILCALIMIYFSANLLFSQNFFDDGKKMFDAGKYNEALENFKKEIENPTSRKKIISYYYIGRTYEQLNNTQAALETYNKIIKEYPNNFLSESALKRIKTLEPLAKIDYNKMTATPQTPQATSQQSKKEQQPKTPPPSSKTEQQKKKSAPPQIKSELIKKEYTYSDELTARKNKTRKNVESEIKAKVRQPLQKKIETVKMIEEPLNPIVLAQQEINNSTTSITLSNETLKDKEEAPKISIPILPPQPVKISAETENLTDSKIEIFRNDTAIQLFKKTEELEQLFKSANDKLSKRLFMDSLEDFKKYADQAQDDNVKKEMAYYKIAEIYHILGQYQDAAKAYLEYIKRYENRQNTYRACFNLANIYFEALGLYNDAKKYYLLALDKTLNVEVINKIKDKITELDKQIKSIETQKQLTTSSPTAPSSAQTNLAAQVNTSGIKLSEKLASEKNIITTFDEEKTAPAQNLQTDLRSSPTAMAKPLITKPAPEMKMAVPEFKQIEPITQKGRQRNISEI